MTFHVWLISLNIMLSRLIYVVVYVSTVSLFLAEYYSIVWIYHLLFLHSSVDRHMVVSTFWLLCILLL